ncbi:MAG: iron dependent repressor, metal binding and dimerization domain protein [Gemmatimonadota bacterium]
MALLAFTGLALLSALLFWPRWGLVSRLRRARSRSERVHLEDALKHLYVCERQGRTPTLEGLAGALGISRGSAAEILSRLVEGRLAEARDGEPALTRDGRAIAVQTLRTHRLWERWLADRTGVRAEDWHAEAEKMEHALSPGETDQLAARLGDPRFDPHGDPIPTSAGELPPPSRLSLQSAPVGRVVRIAHLEDEPPEVYQRLLDRELAPGLTVELLERVPDGVRIRTPRGEVRLDPVAAGHVTVRPLPAGATVEPARRGLHEVRRGETVRVSGIEPACQGPQRRRLLDLGLVPGTEVTPELVSASKDTVAYRIRGALIALRREQARWISVGDGAADDGTGAGDGSSGDRPAPLADGTTGTGR